MMSLVILVTFCISQIPQIHSHSSLVPCATALPVSGHGASTTPGAGTAQLARGSTSLACGSTIAAGQNLLLATQGTSGQFPWAVPCLACALCHAAQANIFSRCKAIKASQSKVGTAAVVGPRSSGPPSPFPRQPPALSPCRSLRSLGPLLILRLTTRC